MKKVEVECLNDASTIKLRAVPIIGEAILDGSVEQKYLAKLERLQNRDNSESLTVEEIKQTPSRLMR